MRRAGSLLGEARGQRDPGRPGETPGRQPRGSGRPGAARLHQMKATGVVHHGDAPRLPILFTR